MLALPEHGRGAGELRTRVDQIRGRKSGTANFTAIAILIGAVDAAFADRAGSADEAVGEERLFHRIVKLFDALSRCVTCGLHALVDIFRQFAVQRRMGAGIMVEADAEFREIGDVFLLHFGDERFRFEAALFGVHHDRRAVRIISADVQH